MLGKVWHCFCRSTIWAFMAAGAAGHCYTGSVIKEGGVFILEHPRDLSFTHHKLFFEHRNYGGVNFSFFNPLIAWIIDFWVIYNEKSGEKPGDNNFKLIGGVKK